MKQKKKKAALAPNEDTLDLTEENHGHKSEDEEEEEKGKDEDLGSASESILNERT